MDCIEATVWEHEGSRRVLTPNLVSADKVLCLLRSASGWTDVRQLCQWLDYSNPSRFRTKILPPIHRKRLIVYERVKDRVILTPSGEEQCRITRISVHNASESSGAGCSVRDGAEFRLRVLCTLLEELFSIHELERFIVFQDRSLMDNLLPNDSLAGLALAAAQGLDRRGMITSEFFARLLEERPRKFDVIAECALRWGVMMR